MSNWQQGPPVGFYPGQGPPPAGFQAPGGYPQPGYPQPGQPQSGYQPGYGGFTPSSPPAYDSVYGGQPSEPNMYGMNYKSDPESNVTGFEFSEKSVRHAFLSYAISLVVVCFLWLLRRVKKLKRLTRLDEDIPDVSPFITPKGIISGQSQTEKFVMQEKQYSARLGLRHILKSIALRIVVDNDLRSVNPNGAISIDWKVYGILMTQLLVSLGFIALFLFHEKTRQYVAKNQWLWGLAFAVMIITLFSIACCGNVRRKAPMNFIFLGLFTVSEGFLLGVAASTFHSNEVFLAVAITAVVCFALTVFAFQTKWDFTLMRGGLFVCCIILFLFGLCAVFIKMKIVTLIYSCLAALLFSIYLIFDTQMMMGGSHKYSISPEEYVFAAITLYLDIVNIFMSILTIIGASRD